MHAAGDRERYVANITSIADRTPLNDVFGSKTVDEIEIVGVYAAVAQPDWAAMKLPFERPAVVQH